MTNFQRDLIRYFDSTKGVDYGSMAEEFFHGGAEYWIGVRHYRRDPNKLVVKLDPPEPYDDTPDHWKAMNVSYQHIDSHGGEGQGDDYWTVYKFTDNNTGEEVYIKFDGWYASYNGAEYTNCFVVQPKEKTITVYE